MIYQKKPYPISFSKFSISLATASILTTSSLLASDIELSKGWNLKYLYNQPIGFSPAALKVTPKSALEILYGYDYKNTNDSKWYCYSEKYTCSNAIESLDATRALWIKTNEAATITESIDTANLSSDTSSLVLHNGWNFIRPLYNGDINSTSKHINNLKFYLSEALDIEENNQTIDIKIYAFDGEKQSWKVSDNGFYLSNDSLDSIALDDGLWIKIANIKETTSSSALTEFLQSNTTAVEDIDSTLTQLLLNSIKTLDSENIITIMQSQMAYENFPNLSPKEKLLLEESLNTMIEFLRSKDSSITRETIFQDMATLMVGEYSKSKRAIFKRDANQIFYKSFLEGLFANYPNIDLNYAEPLSYIIARIKKLSTDVVSEDAIEGIRSSVALAYEILENNTPEVARKVLAVLKPQEVVDTFINDTTKSDSLIITNYTTTDNINFLVTQYDAIAANLQSLGIPSDKITSDLINQIMLNSDIDKATLSSLTGVSAENIQEFNYDTIVTNEGKNINILNPYAPESTEESTPESTEESTPESTESTPESTTTPNSFTFTNITDANFSTEYKSNTVTIGGLSTSIDINITNGYYMLNSDGNWTDINQSAKIASGDTIELNTTSKASYSQTQTVTLLLGTYSREWNVTTVVAIPTITSTYPLNSATNVGLYTVVDINFSRAMDSTTLTASNITINNGKSCKSIDYNTSDYRARCWVYEGTLSDGLAESTLYTLTLNTNIKDANGTSLAANYDLNFTTGKDNKYPRLRTGQVDSNATYDDGWYVNNGLGLGIARSFTRDASTAGQEFVTDSVTDLVWEDNASVATVTKKWENADDNASSYCESLNTSSYASQTGWRLPTSEELTTIVNTGTYNSSIFRNTGEFQNTASNHYWSASTYASDTTIAWLVRFSNSGTSTYAKTNSYYVRCVQGGESTTPQYIRDNTKEMVLDTSSGLMWQDNTTASGMNWANAIDYCENQIGTSGTFAGYSDWRLPNYNELYQLADRSRYSPAISPVFSNTESSLYWSASTYASYTAGAWRVDFSDGFASYLVKTNSGYVRCVRGGQ